jgi:uridylate kinase
MDSTALTHCMANPLPILVFNTPQSGNIKRAVVGERIGTPAHRGRAP